MSLLKLENFVDALLDKYEPQTLNESLNESFVKEWWGQTDEDPRDVADEYGLSVKALSRSGDETLYKFEGTLEAFRDAMEDGYFYSVDFNEDEGHSEDLDESCDKTVNECSEMSFGKEMLTETVARSPRYELEDLGNLIEDAKLALEDKDMENMYLFGHAIYEFIEENKDELNDVVINELGNLQDELEAEAQKLDESCHDSIDEQVEDVYWYSNSEFKEDLVWLANNLTDYFFKEMESAHWGLSKKDITNIFNGALNDVLKKMRESDECTLFESKESLKEDTASAKPNHMAIIDMLESGYLDYKETCEELLRWMPDSELGRFIEIYADFEDLEESVDNSKEDLDFSTFPDSTSLEIGDTLVTTRDFWYCSLTYQTKDSLERKRKIGLIIKDDGVYIPKDSELKIVSMWKRPGRGPALDVLFNGKKIDIPNYDIDDNPKDKFFILAQKASSEEINLRAKINKIIDNFHPVIKQIDNLKIEGEDPYLRVLIADKNSDFEGWMDAWNDGEVIVEWEEHPQPNSDEGRIYFDVINNDKVDEMSGDLVYRKCKKLIPKRFLDLEESVEEIKPTHRGRKLHSEE